MKRDQERQRGKTSGEKVQQQGAMEKITKVAVQRSHKFSQLTSLTPTKKGSFI